jgi:hypothetical protein
MKRAQRRRGRSGGRQLQAKRIDKGREGKGLGVVLGLLTFYDF